MKTLFLISMAIITFGVIFYDNMSYKKTYQRHEVNTHHPSWTPYCSINFLETDPQWFIDNGYAQYVRKKYRSSITSGD